MFRGTRLLCFHILNKSYIRSHHVSTSRCPAGKEALPKFKNKRVWIYFSSTSITTRLHKICSCQLKLELILNAESYRHLKTGYACNAALSSDNSQLLQSRGEANSTVDLTFVSSKGSYFWEVMDITLRVSITQYSGKHRLVRIIEEEMSKSTQLGGK